MPIIDWDWSIADQSWREAVISGSTCKDLGHFHKEVACHLDPSHPEPEWSCRPYPNHLHSALKNLLILDFFIFFHGRWTDLWPFLSTRVNPSSTTLSPTFSRRADVPSFATQTGFVGHCASQWQKKKTDTYCTPAVSTQVLQLALSDHHSLKLHSNYLR